MRGQNAAVVAGGSDLLAMIKEDLVSPELLVNLKSISGMGEVKRRSGGVGLGGLLTLETLSRHPLIRSRYTALTEAARSVATPQIRNVGTLAGNICQRPWCPYFRQGFPCFKHGGDVCYSVIGESQFQAIFGGGPSFIVHPSDTAPALLALGADFRILGPAGERRVSGSEFFVLPQQDLKRENVLEPDEVLVEIMLPPVSRARRSTYAKIMDRQAWTHAVVSVAMALEMQEGVCQSAAIVLGGVAPIPWRLPKVEKMLARRLVTPEVAAEAGKAAVEGANPLPKNAYKVPLTETLVRRTLLSLAGLKTDGSS